MGLLIKGKWSPNWYDTKSSDGKFVRADAQFRNWIGETGFEAEANRYHLYVSLACPWAHRALIFRKIKGLEDIINVSVVKPEMLDDGWVIDDKISRSLGYHRNPIEGAGFLRDIYLKAKFDYTGRVTVPVLWDKKSGTIISNESSDIIRMFNSAFRERSISPTDFYPKKLRKEIDEINEDVYQNINNGVYRAGFATSQEAYETSYSQVFDCLDRLENRLASRRYLVGDEISESDWRLFTTLIRFDMVYYAHFKVNKKRIEDYPNLSNYVRELYQYRGVAETVNFEHIKIHYFYSHATINPTRVVPVGPELDFTSYHDRRKVGMS